MLVKKKKKKSPLETELKIEELDNFLKFKGLSNLPNRQKKLKVQILNLYYNLT